MTTISSVEELEALYGATLPAATVKVSDHITPHYAALIGASPFMALATAGPEGLDCSPRGDRPGELVRILNPRTLLLPDRRGNNRVDSLRNVIRDPRVALLFLIPGSGTTLRVNGRGRVTIAPELLASLAVDGKPPRSVLEIEVVEAYFQCARAVVRSGLWDGGSAPDLPSPGEILADMSAGEIGGAPYDREWPDRARKTLW